MGLSIRLVKRVDGFTLDTAWEMDNEIFVLFGHSGAGKSMTLQLIAGLMEPDEGLIRSGEKVFFDSVAKINLPPQQRSLGYVFQDLALFPHMTVQGNISYGLKAPGKPEREKKVKEMIGLFHLEGLERKYPSEISGGQKQRVALARALVGNPQALILDEPFSALDIVLRLEMRQLLKDIRRRFHTPIILVTHDIFEANALADKVAIYSAGRIIQVGSPLEIFHKPTPWAEDPRPHLFSRCN